MSTQSSVIVQTKPGKLEGIFERDLYTFKGVPYAAPPVGELRWQPPQLHKSWQGVRTAKVYGSIAPQNVMPLPGIEAEAEPQNEDCLFLNVYSPGLDNVRRQADRLSKEIQDAWVSFARTGNPSCKSLGEWPRYDDGRSSMIFDKNSRVEKSACEKERQIWETLDELKYSNMP